MSDKLELLQRLELPAGRTAAELRDHALELCAMPLDSLMALLVLDNGGIPLDLEDQLDVQVDVDRTLFVQVYPNHVSAVFCCRFSVHLT